MFSLNNLQGQSIQLNLESPIKQLINTYTDLPTHFRLLLIIIILFF